MTRSSLGLATALALSLQAGMVQAQTSSVTLSGVADAALRWVVNDGLFTVRSVVSGSNSTSRLAFRGVADLGGGLWAGFHLEHGIVLDTGSPASSTMFFDRRSTFGSGGATTVRSSHAVQWLLPRGWGGLDGEAMVAFREGGSAPTFVVPGGASGLAGGKASQGLEFGLRHMF
jgi:hypothetical protein